MATLRDAERARDQHADTLRRAGAHAIAVEKTVVDGKKTFAVIAMFQKKPRRRIAEVLTTDAGAVVPVVTRIAPAFEPE